MMYSVLLVLALAARGYARPNCFFACDYPMGQAPMPSYPSGNVQPGYPSGNVQPGYPSGNIVQPGYPSGNIVQPGYPSGNIVQPGYPSGNIVQPGYPSGNMVQPPSMVESFGPVYQPSRQRSHIENFQPNSGGHMSFNHESQASQKTSISGSYHFPAPSPPMNEPIYQKPCRIYSDCS